jgi:hypothetical protein
MPPILANSPTLFILQKVSAHAVLNRRGPSDCSFPCDKLASVNSNRVPFTVLMPLLSLVMSVCLVLLPATFDYLAEQQNAIKAEQLSVDQGNPAAAPGRIQIIHNVLSIVDDTSADIINGIMLPGNAIDLPIDRLLPSWPDTWHPTGFSVFSWRAITFPIYCLPFWWFAGYGADALLKRRQPRWPTLLAGTFLCALFVLLAIGGCLAPSPFSTPAVNIPIIIGAFLWTLLFATFPTTWIREGLVCRRRARPAI